MNRMITPAAIAALLVSAAVAAHADNTRELAAANFIEADANGDKALTIDEFTRFIDLNADDRIGNSRLVRRMGRYKTAFNRVDADEDGSVSVEELAALSEQ